MTVKVNAEEPEVINITNLVIIDGNYVLLLGGDKIYVLGAAA